MKILFVDERVDEYQTHCKHLDHQLTFESAVPQNPECDVLVASPALAAGTLKAGATPKWVQSTWAGVDSLLPELEGGSIVLTGIKGIFGQLMSEYVFAYLLSDLRDLDLYKHLQAKRRWDDSKLPDTLSGKTITIVGTGSIGQHLAATAKHFRMTTIGVNRSGAATTTFDRIETDLITAVGAADYVVACLPETKDTRQVFDSSVFREMQSHGIFINVGRGTSVNESDLLQALDSDHLRRVVLDVFQSEPLSNTSPLWSNQKLAMTPHISAPSFTKDIASIFMDNLKRFEGGEPLLYEINLEKGY